jgi:hypothetical protein
MSKYFKTVKDFVEDQYKKYHLGTGQYLTYNVLFNNCFTWAKGITSRARGDACQNKGWDEIRYVKE